MTTSPARPPAVPFSFCAAVLILVIAPAYRYHDIEFLSFADGLRPSKFVYVYNFQHKNNILSLVKSTVSVTMGVNRNRNVSCRIDLAAPESARKPLVGGCYCHLRTSTSARRYTTSLTLKWKRQSKMVESRVN